MATSGTTEKTFRYGLTLIFEWNVSSQTVYGNTSIVNWELKLKADSTSMLYSATQRNCKVVLDGYETDEAVDVNVSGGETKTLAYGLEVLHHSLNGEKTFSYTFQIDFGGTIGVIIGSDSATLPTIVRQATITSALGFDDEGDKPTFWFSNPAGDEVDKLEACISIDGSTAAIDYREISATGSVYSFTLTDTELDNLRNAFPSSDTGTIYYLLKTTINKDVYISSIAKNFSIIHAEPILNPTVVDTGSVSTELTDNSNVMILGYNMMKVTFNASAQKGASITSKKVTCGGDTLTDDGTIDYATSNIFNFTVTDSRGKTTTKTVTLSVIDYIKLTCNFKSVSFITTDSITLNVKGNYFNGSFGAKSNSLTVKYRYKVVGGTYSSLVSMTPTISGNTYTASATISGLDYNNNYVV